MLLLNAICLMTGRLVLGTYGIVSDIKASFPCISICVSNVVTLIFSLFVFSFFPFSDQNQLISSGNSQCLSKHHKNHASHT